MGLNGVDSERDVDADEKEERDRIEEEPREEQGWRWLVVQVARMSVRDVVEASIVCVCVFFCA